MDKTALSELLAERESRYGNFIMHAQITQDLKLIMAACRGWSKLSFDQKESLEMIAHKIGRILNGDPNYEDSWRDIAGYATLVADRLLQVERSKSSSSNSSSSNATNATNALQKVAPYID